MYALSKRALSQYIRRECRRRLRLDLYSGTASRDVAGAPDPDAKRPGLALLVAQGRVFEREKFEELELAFPGRVVHGAKAAHVPGEERAFDEIDLSACIDTAGPDTFLIEAQYEVTAPFIAAHGLGDLVAGGLGGGALRFSRVRPDIIHVVGSGGEPREAITKEGAVVAVDAGDLRLGLRIVDVKLSGEPSPSHFAELAYYGMTLAAWLEGSGRSDRFLVLKDAAIWPGKHEASELRRAEAEDRRQGITAPDLGTYLKALESDLETLPAEVVLGRARQFLAVDLRLALEEEHWSDLPLHVDSSCSGCDYLGYDWGKGAEEAGATRLPALASRKEDRSLYCWATARREDHLSLVTGLPKGACGKLRDADVSDIRRLAELRPTNRVFERHQRLQAGRSLFKARSDVLVAGAAASIPDRAGTSAVLPRRCDVAVALSVDYDVGSGLTFAIGYKLVLAMPTERRTSATGDWYPTRREYGQHRVMLVESKSVDEERNVFMDVMARLVTEMQDGGRRVREAYAGLGKADYVPTTQVYLWDRLNFDHLRRVMGRHLLALLAAPAGADRAAPAPMAWFFPPESVIEDADFTSRNSPVTVVAEAVRALVAANVPHHYSLLNIANEFQPSWTKPTKDGGPHFRVSRLFVDPLSDQIPSERGHEVWNRRSPFPTADWQEYRDSLKRVVRTRLDAVLSVVDRLVENLRADLAADAPALDAVLGGTKLQGAMSRDSEILYQHARLMAAAAALENDLHMAMPPHQREASFASVRLTGLLEGADKAAALEALGRGDLATAADILVFTVSERSRQAKIKAGTFDWSLMPEDALKLQYTKIPTLKRRNPALELLLGPPEGWESRMTVRQFCQVDVVAVDRVGGTVAVRARSPFIGAMRQTGLFDLDVDGKTRFAILDPLVVDYFVKKRLRPALRGIATPPLSLDRPLFRDRVLTRLRMGRRGPNRTRPVPAERFVWDADALSREPSGNDATPALAAIAATGRSLTPKQADAVRQSIERRLSLLWGPPGTGKSTTAVALLYGLLWEARRSGRAIRIAISGPTWVAIDTVAKKVPGLLAELGMDADVGIARLATTPPAPDGIAPELVDHLVLTDYGVDHVGLIERLSDASRSTVVAATATQLAKLTDDDHPLRPFFDFMLVDEASQMSVAHGMVAYTTLADGASLTVVGDNLQMPPIQPVAPPEGAKHLVGSLYDFYHRYREGEAGASGVVPVQLDVSFRSNKEIVEFVRLAGYRDRLEAAFPDLRMRLVPGGHNRLGGEGAAAIDAFLDRVLDPRLPLVAVIHQDEFSSQRNDPEAEMVATMVWALRGTLLPEKGDAPLSPEDFYRHGIGVVTPHRAQQAAVVERLMQVAETKGEREALLSAVDTVERFQGQEKTVMVASFGLGDVDQIAAEEEFLYSLNRFNVIASRAKAKLIVILSRKLVDYLPRTPETLRESRLLKHYADGHLPSLGRVSWPELGECDLRGR